MAEYTAVEVSTSPLAPRRPKVLLSSVSSDSHTWNLVFLQLLLEETGHDVVNIGACVPDDLLVAECAEHRPDVVVISTVNGHGAADGKRLITRIRTDPALRGLTVVIGGKLGVAGAADHSCAAELVDAGFDAVFQDNADVGDFLGFIESSVPSLEVGV
ncbi:cobalamin-dependent protein [Lentzea sp. NBRC 105346]|uniref:cobalamin B12-binding domain-containing protein n=1 Tax=Lentzea sp. NBRC 105346 TaxID=3032205 RepID=UPI0025543994|nr:cobalamin-dependent protein [Lentzea sp. NBRC 105346]